MPAECDVSIRPGWFWHQVENARVKTPAELIELYYRSAGRGANLLLNVPPNRQGLLQAEDVASLKSFGEYRRTTFGKNLLNGARVMASQFRGKDPSYGPAKLIDGREDTYWATDDDVLLSDATFEPARPVTFNVVRVREAIRFGQRLDGIAVDCWNGGAWEEVAHAQSAGPRRLIRLGQPVRAPKIRLRVTRASASPAIEELAIFLDQAAR
jgi:alpha-L-fucosidase